MCQQRSILLLQEAVTTPTNHSLSQELSSRSFLDDDIRSKVLGIEKQSPTESQEPALKRRKSISEPPRTPQSLKRLCKILDIPADESLLVTLTSIQAKLP